MAKHSSDKELEQLFTSYMGEELFLNREGEWFHEGTRFTHKKLAQLFHRSIQWDEELEQYVLRIGRGRATFSHEGYVRFITSLTEECNTLTAHFADGTTSPLLPEQLCMKHSPTATFILNTPSHPPARFTRTAHQQLLQHAESENSIRIGNTTYQISSCEGA
jgi:hypothetical protein